ncbi:hypothetical protein P43SY_008158 [Pythium insidiosum]|uniref:Uncharacterized protein n=1 Tax=Pythium insidiosum TaxID=114742 RepID=A0AAD5Q656_PYTIN|nr:hypothetical protein P43SY_008158 [Pythium insidiosum]
MSSVHDSDGFASSSSERSHDDGALQRRRARLPSHAAAARDLVGPQRRRESTSVRVHPLAVGAQSRRLHAAGSSHRRATAPPAVQSALPSSADRLKHLQIHMEQLQQLYSEELHLEEMAAREAFVQSVCTSSITLLRYCASRGTFFTAVRALVTQYLPASDARLFQVEWAGDTETETETETETQAGMALVQHDDSVVPVRYDNRQSIGIAGRAALETARLRPDDWKLIRDNAASTRSDDEGSRASSQEPLASARRRSSWLDRHLDCAVPLGSNHVLFAFTQDVAHRSAGWTAGIDLSSTPRKDNASPRFGAEPELVVVVICDATERRRPVAVLEALCTVHKSPLRVEFLDAFASLVAAAMETRSAICRPVTSSVAFQIVGDRDELPTRPVLAFDLGEDAKLVVLGDRFVNVAHDGALLRHLCGPLGSLISDKQRWKRQSDAQDRVLVALRAFFSTLAVAAASSSDHQSSLRSASRDAITELSSSLKDGSLRVLFDHESLVDFEHEYGYGSQCASVPLTLEAQYAALRRVVDQNESFASSSNVLAVAVPSFSPDCPDALSRAGVLLMLPSTDSYAPSSNTLREMLLPIVQSALSVVLALDSQRGLLHLVQQELVQLEDRCGQAERRQLELQALTNLAAQLTLSSATTAELVRSVNALESCSPLLSELNVLGLKLFAVDVDECEQLQTAWTVDPDDGRVVLFEHTNSPPSDSMARGIALFVLQQAAPLVYSPDHPSFDPSWRGRQRDGHQWFVGVPLVVDAVSAPAGVLEISLADATARDQFLESPVCGELTRTLASLLVAVQRADRVRADGESVQTAEREATAAAWDRWSHVVSACLVDDSDSGEHSSSPSWRESVVEKVSLLLPTADVVDLVVAHDDDERDTSLVARVLVETSNSRPTSEAFNVRHGAVFGQVEAVAVGNGSGVLVAAKQRAGSAFATHERQLLALCGAVVSWRITTTRRRRALERDVDALTGSNARLESQLVGFASAHRALERRSWVDASIAALWTTADAEDAAGRPLECLSTAVHALTADGLRVVVFWCEDATVNAWWQVEATGSQRRRDDGRIRHFVDSMISSSSSTSSDRRDDSESVVHELCGASRASERVVTAPLADHDGAIAVIAPSPSAAAELLSADGVTRLARAVSAYLQSHVRATERREAMQQLVVERERVTESERRWRQDQSAWLETALAAEARGSGVSWSDVVASVRRRLETRTNLQALRVDWDVSEGENTSALWTELSPSVSRRLLADAYIARWPPHRSMTIRWTPHGDDTPASVDCDALDAVALDVGMATQLIDRMRQLSDRLNETERELEATRDDARRLDRSLDAAASSRSRRSLVCETARALMASSSAVAVHQDGATATWLSQHGVALVAALPDLELWVVEAESETAWTLSPDGVRHVAPLKDGIVNGGECWGIHVDGAAAALLRWQHEPIEADERAEQEAEAEEGEDLRGDVELLVASIECVLLRLRRQDELQRAEKRQRLDAASHSRQLDDVCGVGSALAAALRRLHATWPLGPSVSLPSVLSSVERVLLDTFEGIESAQVLVVEASRSLAGERLTHVTSVVVAEQAAPWSSAQVLAALANERDPQPAVVCVDEHTGTTDADSERLLRYVFVATTFAVDTNARRQAVDAVATWLGTAIRGTTQASSLMTRLEAAAQERDATREELALVQQWLAHEQALRSELLDGTRRCLLAIETNEDENENTNEQELRALGQEMQLVAWRFTGCESVVVFAVEPAGGLRAITETAEAVDPRRRRRLEDAVAHWDPQRGVRLEHDDQATTLVVTSDGSVSAAAAVGLVVLHGSTTREDVETTLLPWLGLWLTRWQRVGTTRRCLHQLRGQITTLQSQRDARELEALERKRHLADVESRRLETTQRLDATSSLAMVLARWIEAAQALGPPEGAVWTALVAELSGLEALCGVQLLALEGNEWRRLAGSQSPDDDGQGHTAASPSTRALPLGASQSVTIETSARPSAPALRLVAVLKQDTVDLELLRESLTAAVHTASLRVDKLRTAERLALLESTRDRERSSHAAQAQELQAELESLRRFESRRSALIDGLLDGSDDDVWHRLTARLAPSIRSSALVQLWRSLEQRCRERLPLVASTWTGRAYVQLLGNAWAPERARESSVFACAAGQEGAFSWLSLARRPALWQCVAEAALTTERPADERRSTWLVPVVVSDQHVVGVLAIEGDGASLETDAKALLSSLAAAIAPRAEWIARVVGRKLSQRARKGAARRTAMKERKEEENEEQDGREPDAEARLEDNQRHNDQRPSGRRQEEAEAEAKAEHDDDDDDDDDDGGDNSDAERRRLVDRTRREASWLRALAAWLCRLQQVAESDDGSGASLRTAVHNDVRSVWTASGDRRKELLARVELFFVVGGRVSESLPPSSCEDHDASRLWLRSALAAAARARAGGYQLFKADAQRWLVLRDALRASEDENGDDEGDGDGDGMGHAGANAADCGLQVVLVLRTKRSSRHPLAALVDAADERTGLPLIARGIALSARRLLAAAMERRRALELCRELGASAQHDIGRLRSAHDALQRRLERETELHDLAAQWLVAAADEDAVGRGVVDVVQRWLACDDVTLLTTGPGSGPGSASAAPAPSSRGVVDVENVVRLRVPAPSASSAAPATLATVVVRLTPQHHARLCAEEDERALQSALARLATLAGVALAQARERAAQREREAALDTATRAVQTLQQDVAALETRNEQAAARAEELERELVRVRSVDAENAALREATERMQTQALAHARDRQALVAQVKRMETQLIEVNCQLEQSIRSEHQRLRLEDAHAELQARAQAAERKLLKRKLEAQRLADELVARRQQHERDQQEIAALRQELAVLSEKQQQQRVQSAHTAALDPSAVASVAVQAAHAHAEKSASHALLQQQQQMQLQREQADAKARRQRRLLRRLQQQEQQQRRKQLDLAQELRQLASLEVQEMRKRELAQRERALARHEALASPKPRARAAAAQLDVTPLWTAADERSGPPAVRPRD